MLWWNKGLLSVKIQILLILAPQFMDANFTLFLLSSFPKAKIYVQLCNLRTII